MVYNQTRLRPFLPPNPSRPWLSCGRPGRRFFSSREALLLLLRYLASGGFQDDLSLLSSCQQSVFSKTVQHALHCLLVTLERWRLSKICLPKTNRGAQYLADCARSYVFARKGVLIKGNFIGALDGAIVSRQRPANDDWQQTNYNGKSNEVSAKMMFLTLFDGTIGAMVVNFIGSAHDSKIAAWMQLFEEMRNLDPSFVIAGKWIFFCHCLALIFCFQQIQHLGPPRD